MTYHVFYHEVVLHCVDDMIYGALHPIFIAKCYYRVLMCYFFYRSFIHNNLLVIVEHAQ